MSAPQFKATMTIPKNGMALWNDILQNPTGKLPQGITEDNYIVASYAKFSDGVTVFGGIAVGAPSQGYNYALFMVFDQNMQQVGGWPIDTSDWDSWSARSIQFAVDPNDDEGNYELDIREATS